MKKHFRLLYIFAIISLLVMGCSQAEDKQAVNQPTNDTNKQQKSGMDEIEGDQPSEDSSDSTGTDDASNQGNKETTDNKDQSSDSNEKVNAGGDEEMQDMPTYEVSFRAGITPQQRLVEVKVDTDKPGDYYVAVNTKVLKYRNDVNLYVGVIDSDNEEEITKAVQVFKRQS